MTDTPRTLAQLLAAGGIGPNYPGDSAYLWVSGLSQSVPSGSYAVPILSSVPPGQMYDPRGYFQSGSHASGWYTGLTFGANAWVQLPPGQYIAFTKWGNTGSTAGFRGTWWDAIEDASANDPLFAIASGMPFFQTYYPGDAMPSGLGYMSALLSVPTAVTTQPFGVIMYQDSGSPITLTYAELRIVRIA